MGDNVVPLRPSKKPVQANKPAQALDVDVAITPKSILDMTEVEQELFLRSLRDRRLKAAAAIASAHAAKRHVSNIQNNIRLEKKIEQVQKQHDKVASALEKLESMVLSLRALQLHVTPTHKEVPDGA